LPNQLYAKPALSNYYLEVLLYKTAPCNSRSSKSTFNDVICLQVLWRALNF